MGARIGVEDTVRNVFRQSGLLDLRFTRKYTFWFLKTACFGDPGSGGVAQLGERLNGIQEVRGSIPLASIGAPCGVGQQEEPGRCLSGWTRVVPAMKGTGTVRAAGIAQLVEHNLAKVGVAGSSPVSRSVVGWGTRDGDGG